MNNQSVERVKATELPSWLLSRGITSVTTDEIAALIHVPKNQVPQRMAPLKKRHEIVLLTSGLWVPVPPEYMTWGAPPAIEFIEAMMQHMGTGYYVGWLSAAELLGASHHAPQTFQVAVTRAIRPSQIGRSRLHFYQRDHVRLIGTVNFETKSGFVPVSSRETTMLDATNDLGLVGGIDHAVNLVTELCEAPLDPTALAALAAHYPISAVRRLGFILEHFTDSGDAGRLKQISDSRKASVSLLDPQSANTGAIDANWCLKINREVNPDV